MRGGKPEADLQIVRRDDRACEVHSQVARAAGACCSQVVPAAVPAVVAGDVEVVGTPRGTLQGPLLRSAHSPRHECLHAPGGPSALALLPAALRGSPASQR